MTPRPYLVRRARSVDLPELLRVQHRAFRRVAAELGIEPPDAMPPLGEDVDALAALHESGTDFFVALDSDSTIVGGVRATPSGDTVHVGRLVVDDGHLRRGVASALMDALEDAHPEFNRFELFTGADASAPLALYATRGYREFARETAGPVELVWLEKLR